VIWVDGLIRRVMSYLDVNAARATAERLAEERGSAMSQENVEIAKQWVVTLHLPREVQSPR
jgi:hypothetical protein